MYNACAAPGFNVSLESSDDPKTGDEDCIGAVQATSVSSTTSVSGCGTTGCMLLL